MTTAPTSRIDDMLAAARARLRRLDARDVPAAVQHGAVLVDIRPQEQRSREGAVPGALVIERNVLEWRCDPTSDARLTQARSDDVEWVVFCSEGYTSSLAAAALHDLGLHRATDVVGGYWALAGTAALAELTRAATPARSPARAAAPSSARSSPVAAKCPPTR
ncbi:MAG: sulfurtransferase [Mycobacteriaceae bacterium]|nr:sulfurtransferase [Mycobacteriaceae bacterium]MBV9516020.1 sulfurtransferase [Mycobacteriaceae bacterium]